MFKNKPKLVVTINKWKERKKATPLPKTVFSFLNIIIQ